MDDNDRLNLLREALAPGIAEAERGEGVELTTHVWEAIERQADDEERLGLPLDDLEVSP